MKAEHPDAINGRGDTFGVQLRERVDSLVVLGGDEHAKHHVCEEVGLIEVNLGAPLAHLIWGIRGINQLPEPITPCSSSRSRVAGSHARRGLSRESDPARRRVAPSGAMHPLS
jgi:hypothetical protein